MIDALEAVASLVKPVAVTMLLACDRLESGVAYDPVSDELARDPMRSAAGWGTRTRSIG